jgi:hypothetical protein
VSFYFSLSLKQKKMSSTHEAILFLTTVAWIAYRPAASALKKREAGLLEGRKKGRERASGDANGRMRAAGLREAAALPRLIARAVLALSCLRVYGWGCGAVAWRAGEERWVEGGGGGSPAETKRERAARARAPRGADHGLFFHFTPRPQKKIPVSSTGIVALFVPAHTREAFFQVRLFDVFCVW